jgi:cell division protein FtsL
MARVNVFLILVLVACAFAVITGQHRARKLYSEIDRQRERARQLDVEFVQLQLEAGTLAAHPRVEGIARKKLQMQLPGPGQVVVVHDGLGGQR